MQAKVALVTRNTTQSVDAFFELVGQEWRSLFSEIRTREFRYVKPDKRLLLELAEVGWALCSDCGTRRSTEWRLLRESHSTGLHIHLRHVCDPP